CAREYCSSAYCSLSGAFDFW
nr:immunoglobulin heavy chain junction region [Macaca mulatta]MOY22398.1 immunoglobulin heavy chain junction region [Macaca mulatta]MOY22966.1 immunoglobulin heavy chain junction region [Macaca mulatta]MOY23015.1 immunoglobulin heavy chain junction region [Macaca mulatta]MOY23232.1 immunoglobulin heavy chain junction region [Macaca mulatta]